MNGDTLLICPRCSTAQPTGHRYCSQCGESLRGADKAKRVRDDKARPTERSDEFEELARIHFGFLHRSACESKSRADAFMSQNLDRMLELEKQLGEQEASEAMQEAFAIMRLIGDPMLY